MTLWRKFPLSRRITLTTRFCLYIQRQKGLHHQVLKVLYLLGWASWLPTTAAMLGFLLSPTGGWVTSAPRKITWTIKCVPKLTNTMFFSTHRLVENFWSDGWNQDRVHSSQFYIDLGLTRWNFITVIFGLDWETNWRVFTFRHKLESVWGEVLFTFLAWEKTLMDLAFSFSGSE